MDFINHTIAWCKGEIFEGRMFFLFGMLVLIVALSYWKWGKTPNAKAMVIPLLVVALFSSAVALSLNFNNQSRIVKYQQAYAENAEGFIQSEKERTDAFIKWYPYTLFTMAGLIIFGLLIFLFLKTPTWKAIGIGLVLLGFSVIFLDHFSEERAETYHKAIVEQLKSNEATLEKFI